MKKTATIVLAFSIIVLLLVIQSCIKSSTNPKDDNADLSNLVLSSGTLTPEFSSDVLNYTATVLGATTNITVTPTAAGAEATVSVNGEAVTSGSASFTIPLSVGETTITTVVTVEDGENQKTYTVTVTREDTVCTPKAVTPDTTTYPVLVLKNPLGCETFSLGDTVNLEWTYYQQNFGRVAVLLSLEGGWPRPDSTFEFIWNNAIPQTTAEGDTTWVIPNDTKYVSDSAVIRIFDYDGGFGEKSNLFSIVP